MRKKKKKLNDECFKDAQNIVGNNLYNFEWDISFEMKFYTRYLGCSIIRWLNFWIRIKPNAKLALTTGVAKKRGKTIIVREPLKRGENETYNFLNCVGAKCPLFSSPIFPQQDESSYVFWILSHSNCLQFTCISV